MSEATIKAIENRRLFRRIGDFLATHGLDPTSANYALVHRSLSDEASSAGAAVREATADGIRLSQREADRIARAEGLDSAPAAGVDPELIAAARRQVDSFASIVEDTRERTRSFGADLQQGAARLDAARPASVVELIRITRTMMERTRAAEAQLATAREEAQSLRTKLATVEEQARSDPLTRLPNRRAFEDQLARFEAARTPHSIAICDIDRFKQVNDVHGHGVGDRVLRMIAQVLEENCEGHMVARLGGEEFVVLFENCAPPAAAAILDRARETLALRQFRVRETDAPLGLVTFSAGVAAGGPAAEAPLKRADALLYEAKNAGRNRVRFEAGPVPRRLAG